MFCALFIACFLFFSTTDSPQLSIPQPIIAATEFSSVTVTVQVSAHPFPDSIEVTPPNQEGALSVVASNQTTGIATVFFPMVNRSNSGMYIVTASNFVGSGSFNFSIDVHCKSE